MVKSVDSLNGLGRTRADPVLGGGRTDRIGGQRAVFRAGKCDMPVKPQCRDRRVCAAARASFILLELGGSNSVVECDLAKVEVAGSNPVSRSRHFAALALAFCMPGEGFWHN